MNTVNSMDGTPIAFERFGEGAPAILVAGALCDRAMMRPLAAQLAGERFAVISYDRRGRGDSGDGGPYAVEREIEDLEALIAEVGGRASVYGHSSGAGLVLHAAAADLAIASCVLHEPPYNPDGHEEAQISRKYVESLEALLKEDRRGDAVELFMTTVGMPPEAVAQMREDPWWARAEAMAPTLAYDSAVMGDAYRGGAIPAELLAEVHAPTLVLCGGAGPEWMIAVGRRIADGLANGHHRVLEGQGHVVAPEMLAPVLKGFFGDR